MFRRSRALFALVFAAAALATAVSLFAQFKVNPGEREQRSADSLRRAGSFCRLDYDGARLSTDGWARLQPLTVWHENPEFAAISVVVRYQILPEVKYERGHSMVSVKYTVFGRYDLREGYLADPGSVTAQLELEDSGDPRIADIDPPWPFVGQAKFLQWLEAKIDNERDPAMKAVFEASLRRFQEQTAKPGGAQ